MPAITQDYNNNNTFEPKLSYPDDQWEEEVTEVLPRQSPRLVKHTTFVSSPRAGISQAALNLFMGNLYMQELHQSIAENSNSINMEEVANDDVHPIPKETIMKYTK